MYDTFFDGLDEFYHHAKFGDRTTRVVRRCGVCFLPAGLPRSGKLPVLNFSFFAPQGRLVAPIHVKLCRVDGHMGPFGCAKGGDSLDRFLNFLGDFIRLSTLH